MAEREELRKAQEEQLGKLRALGIELGNEPSPPTPTAAVDYFADPTSIPRVLKEAATCAPCRATEVTIYPTSARVQLQDALRPLNLDDYWLDADHLKSKTPVQILGEKPTVERIAKETFNLESDVVWTVLPRLVSETPRLLKLDDVVVSHMTIKRFLPFSSDVRVMVYAHGERRSGFVEFKANGQVTKIRN